MMEMISRPRYIFHLYFYNARVVIYYLHDYKSKKPVSPGRQTRTTGFCFFPRACTSAHRGADY